MGANLFAKTVVQKMHFRRIYRPFREQVRSCARRVEARLFRLFSFKSFRNRMPTRSTHRYAQVRFGFWPEAVGANLFAKTVVQKMHFRRIYRPFREQVRSYARWAEARLLRLFSFKSFRNRMPTRSTHRYAQVRF
ncbi:hypothetical protein V476_09195 [Pseudomonas syringae KCTC 12500]|nr:hypothetical protein V476_09195 [Pseudomonas syringae KCTC 12500]